VQGPPPRWSLPEPVANTRRSIHDIYLPPGVYNDDEAITSDANANFFLSFDISVDLKGPECQIWCFRAIVSSSALPVSAIGLANLKRGRAANRAGPHLDACPPATYLWKKNRRLKKQAHFNCHICHPKGDRSIVRRQIQCLTDAHGCYATQVRKFCQ